MKLTSETNPRVKRVVRLRKSAGSGGRRATGLLLAEGSREVTRAVAAGLTIESVYVSESATESARGAADAVLSGDVERVGVSDAVMKKMSYHAEPEGVLVVARRPATGLGALPASVDSDGVGGLWLVAVGTEKPGNLGAMVRTAEAVGCSAVVAAGTPVDAFHPNAIRASTGAVFSTPIATCDEAEAIAALESRGVAIVAAMVEGETTLDAFSIDPRMPTAVAIGPEDAALNAAWAEAANRSGGAAVRIPTTGRVVDSLNASVAAGVVLFELARRRRSVGV